MLRFGFVSFWAYFITFVYILATIGLLVFSGYFIIQVDWTQPISIGGAFVE
jgi:hypothetical protein